MSIIAWLILGLLAGWIGSNIVDSGGRGPLLDIILGIVGALVGGFIFSALGAVPITGFNLYSLIVAVVGSVVVLVLYHGITGRRARLEGSVLISSNMGGLDQPPLSPAAVRH